MSVKKPRKLRKILVDWTENRVQKLIESVEAEPVLWNVSLFDHRNKTKRDAAWNNMSEFVFNNKVSVNDLNVKWQGLRSQYKMHLNAFKKKTSGYGTDSNYTVRWKYYQQLKFLDAGEANMNEEDSIIGTQSNFSDSTMDLTPDADGASCSTPQRKKKSLPTNAESVWGKAMDPLQQVQDDAQIFGDFIANAIRELPTKKSQHDLKRTLNGSLLSFQDSIASGATQPLEERSYAIIAEDYADDSESWIEKISIDEKPILVSPIRIEKPSDSPQNSLPEPSTEPKIFDRKRKRSHYKEDHIMETLIDLKSKKIELAERKLKLQEERFAAEKESINLQNKLFVELKETTSNSLNKNVSVLKLQRKYSQQSNRTNELLGKIVRQLEVMSDSFDKINNK